MTIKLNRLKIVLIGVVIVILYLLLNRLEFWGESKTTMGVVIGCSNVLIGEDQLSMTGSPIVAFELDSSKITFQSEERMSIHAGEEVEVIYNVSNPLKAEIYSFVGIWLSPIIYALLPLIILLAAAFSFLSAKDNLTIGLGKQLTISKSEQQSLDEKQAERHLK